MSIIKNLDEMLAVRRSDFDSCLNIIDHKLKVNSLAAEIRFHHLKFDGNGKPMVAALANKLFEFIIDYCLSMQDRPDKLTTKQAMSLSKEARSLFRHPEISDESPDKTGEAGETLLFFLMEAIIGAPQLVSKMELKTNSNDEVKGSDGIHIKWNDHDSIVDFYFGESKLYKKMSDAIDAALISINDFHENKMYSHEFTMATKHFKYAQEEVKQAIKDLFVSGEPGSGVRINYACLIGFNWSQFSKLQLSSATTINNQFIALVEKALPRWITLLDKKFSTFEKKHLRFDVFFVPFPSVVDFRNEFNKALD